MELAEEILNKHIPVGVLQKVTVQCVVDACHEFSDQFKKWILINPDNKPTKEIPVICFTPNIGQEIGAYKIGCYWYRVSDGQKIYPTHFHYQLPDPE